MIQAILNKAHSGLPLNREDALNLLEVTPGSAEYYAILAEANRYSRKAFQNRGLLFAQIGLDAQPCGINCKFCSLSKDTFGDQPVCIKSVQEVVAQAKLLAESTISDLFLMTTAEFSQQEYLAYGRAVRAVLPQTARLVANVGDFGPSYAKELKEAGFTGVYHIHRLGEGIDTCAAPAARIKTMNAVREAGLELYYCVEPIGPEHSNEALVEEMLRIRDYPVGVMAVMKRTAVPGTALAARGEISAVRLAQICAVTTLATRPPRAMCVHEPDELCLMAGANQIYAEFGVNPRDMEKETQKNRGLSIAQAEELLKKTEWEI